MADVEELRDFKKFKENEFEKYLKGEVDFSPHKQDIDCFVRDNNLRFKETVSYIKKPNLEEIDKKINEILTRKYNIKDYVTVSAVNFQTNVESNSKYFLYDKDYCFETNERYYLAYITLIKTFDYGLYFVFNGNEFLFDFNVRDIKLFDKFIKDFKSGRLPISDDMLEKYGIKKYGK